MTGDGSSPGKPGDSPCALFNCFSLQLTLCGTGIINLQVRRTTTFSQETLQLIKNVRGRLFAVGFDF